MPRVQRSPPATPSHSDTETSKSEPNLSNVTFNNDFVNSAVRAKRFRPEFSPEATYTEKGTTSSSGSKNQEANISDLIASQTEMIRSLVTDVAEIKSQNVQIQKSNEDIERSMHFINTKFEEMRLEIKALKQERLEQADHIRSLENKIQELQQSSRPSGVELRNVPHSEGENHSTLVNTVNTIGHAVGIPSLQSEIRDIYRLPKVHGKPETSRPIIVEFKSVQTKENLLSAVRHHNKKATKKEDKLNTQQIGITGSRQGVYISEQLPGSVKKLFFAARELTKSKGYSFCWVKNGNIFIRKSEGDKQILIKSEYQLKELFKSE